LRADDHARPLTDLLLPRKGFSVLLGSSAYHGAADRYLGLLASTLGDHDAAIEHHTAAMQIHERMRARTWLARSWYDLAGALIARDADGDRDRAMRLLNDALDAANDVGMTKLVQEVLTLKLELQGVASGTSVTASIDIVAAGVSIERPDLKPHAAANGTITVLFSDVEGYTQLNERLGDTRTQAFLREHDTIVRETVNAHEGTVVKSVGDGYMIVFREPARGLSCAVELQRAMAARDFGSDVGAIRVRIGLHSGEAIREGDDFFGRTVILASRIAAEAEGGEILVSQALAPHAESGASDGKLGAARDVELKGIRGLHTIYRVVW
jgi:class 3 adenylate cyclase